MYKLIAIDLDETLFNAQHKIDDENKKAIALAIEKGIKIVPCSGRGPGFLGTLYDDLGINNEQEYSILCNGAIVIENHTSNIISCSPLAYEKALELFAFGRSKDLCVQIFTPDKVYVYFADEEEREVIKHFGDNIIFLDTDETAFLKDEVIIKVLFEKPDSLAYLQTLEEELKPLTEGHITVSFSSNRYLELNALGIHKGIGLLSLANHLGIDISETIGVGDNYNDLGLLEDAGLGVAVQNAIAPVKAIADVVTIADHNQSAIAEVIYEYVLPSYGDNHVR